MKNIRLGDVLIEFGYITPDQLNTALAYQKEHRDLRVGQAMHELRYLNERQVLEALAQRLQLTMIDIEHTNVDVTAVEKVPQELAQKYDMLPIAQSPHALTIAANDPLNYYAIEDIRQLTGLEPEIVLAELEPLRRAIRYYYAEVGAQQAAQTANEDFAERNVEMLQVEESESGDPEAPIVKLLNSLLDRAISTGASDVHIEPFEGSTRVRMRIDGTIVDYVTLQRSVHQPLIARIKIMSNLDIAEHRIPQDGHFRARLETGPDVNVRVSILPTVFGEKAVLRILSSNTYIKNANHFGMNDETYKRFLPLLNRPNGIVYLTGPTGSGKTTTLYMVLQTIAERQVNVSTIEDPVERNLARINQTQVNNIAGLTFESGLRALLRQDPDVIMVGETRDADIEKTLLGLGFKRSDFGRATSEFSGGWRMRIELAKLLLRRPSIFLLDEPTNHLDIESIQWLEEYLKSYNGAVLVISHDRAFLDNVTTRTVELSLGKIYDYKVPYSKYVVLRAERRAQQLAAYENQQRLLEKTEALIEKLRYKPTHSNHVQ